MLEQANLPPAIVMPLLSLPPALIFLLLVVGAAVLTGWIYSFVRLMSSLFILPGKKLSTFGPPSKSWAIVSGASDGLGREYALQLARAGFKVMLLARTESKLDSLAKEIMQKYHTHALSFTIDFADTNDETAWKELKKCLAEDIESSGGVSILINNVGVSHGIPVSFAETPAHELQNIVNVNCLATLKLTQLVLPGMIQRRRGLILTMGSFGGTLPTPLLATYSGSKAFLQQWSTALASELTQHNITVHLIQSYLVATAMSKIRRTSAMVPGPREYVGAVLGKIGRTGGAQGYAYSGTPWWSHAVYEWVIINTLGVGSAVVLGINRRMHEGIRTRALKKERRVREEGRKGQ